MSGEPADRLSPEEGEALLRIARAAIQDRLLGDGSLGRALAACPMTPALQARRGVFVTLRKRVPVSSRLALRGCIGTLKGREPLYLETASCALSAAFQDPRFPPVQAHELDDLVLDVTVLTPRRPIGSVEEIQIGRHGVALERGPYRAVFLPQVPVEQRWDREQLLEQLALKAGLPPDGWREAKLEVFEGQVFEETH